MKTILRFAEEYPALTWLLLLVIGMVSLWTVEAIAIVNRDWTLVLLVIGVVFLNASNVWKKKRSDA